MLILQYERCRERYDEELRRTYRFLGLEPDRGGGAVPPREPREHPLPGGRASPARSALRPGRAKALGAGARPRRGALAERCRARIKLSKTP